MVFFVCDVFENINKHVDLTLYCTIFNIIVYKCKVLNCRLQIENIAEGPMEERTDNHVQE